MYGFIPLVGPATLIGMREVHRRKPRRKARRQSRRSSRRPSTQQDIEKILAKAGTDKSTAKQFENISNALSITDTVSGVAMSAATPAVAGAAGVGAAAAGGTAALASAFPVGTIIVAVPIVISLGLSVAKGDAEKKAKYLTKDQQHLVKLIKKYNKKKQKWRLKKAKQFLTEYSKHLDWGNKETLAPWDGKKRHKHEQGWKARKAELEMKLTAIYVAEYNKSPTKKPTKKEQQKSRNIIRTIQRKQKKSIDPVTSPYTIQGRKLMLNKPLLKKQTARVLQRPGEITEKINKKKPSPPQSVAKTLVQSPAALDGSIELAQSQNDDVSTAALLGVSGLAVLGVVGSILL
jgi:hypothetical protein